MLIISKHKDYYDSAVGMGIDKTIVYERTSSQINPPPEIYDLFGMGHYDMTGRGITYQYYYTTRTNEQDKCELIYIGFCGKLYVGFKFTEMVGDINKTEMTYDINEVKKKLNLHKKSTELKTLNNLLLKVASLDPMEIFRKYNTPIFAFGFGVDHIVDYRSRVLESFFVNPILLNYQFAKVFDPYTAFQEIQMFISGTLGVREKMTETKMKEKDKIAQHGMDKWSFRRKPTK